MPVRIIPQNDKILSRVVYCISNPTTCNIITINVAEAIKKVIILFLIITLSKRSYDL